MVRAGFIAMLRGETARWSWNRTLRYFAERGVLLILILSGAIIYILPFVLMVSTSLKAGDAIYVRPFQWIPESFHFENYVQAWTAFPFSLYLRNTLFITIANMIGAVITTSMAGYALARLRFPARSLFFGMVIASLLLPSEVTFIPEYLIWWQLGAVNTYVPLIAPGWLAVGASKIFLLRQFFRTLPVELEEAAKMDGATPLDTFVRIALPLSKPAVGVVLIFEFIGKWNSFIDPLIYLKDPDKYTLTVGLNMFKDAYSEQYRNMPDMHYFMAIATLIVLPILAIFVFLQRYFVEGIQLTGLKG